MASGSLGRGGNSGSKGFGFGSDDILCSYEDYDSNLDGNNGTPADSSIGANSSKDVILTVEKTMKKYSDNLMRFLEGISSRLSQLELYCYNLDKSIGEMHSDLVRDHDESEIKLKSLEKHIQEVYFYTLIFNFLLSVCFSRLCDNVGATAVWGLLEIFKPVRAVFTAEYLLVQCIHIAGILFYLLVYFNFTKVPCCFLRLHYMYECEAHAWYVQTFRT